MTIFIAIFMFNLNVSALGFSLSVSNSEVYVGDSFTVSLRVSQVAAWNVHLVSSGPVATCLINQADATLDALDTNKTFTTTCKATGEGVISLSLSGDVTSASDGNAVMVSDSKSVTVRKRPTNPSGENNNGGNTGKNNSNNSTTNNRATTNNNTSNNNNPEEKSGNTELKELTVEGYTLNKIDDNSFTLTVPFNITNVNIKATAVDENAKVEGSGNKTLNTGENNFEIIVTAPNGTSRKISVKITRKDSYTIDDLENTLKNDKLDVIDITIDKNTIITKSNLEKIKNSKKKVNFNYYDEAKKLIYSFTIDGKQIKKLNDLTVLVVMDSSFKKDMLRLSNYADGLFMNVNFGNDILKKLHFKIYVGNKYSDNDLVNIYFYNKKNDKLELCKKKVKVTSGYISFDTFNSGDYLITMSLVNGVQNNKNSNSLLIILGLILGLIIIFLIFRKRRNKKNTVVNNEGESKSIYKNEDDII